MLLLILPFTHALDVQFPGTTGWEKAMSPEMLAKSHPWGISAFQKKYDGLDAAQIIVRDIALAVHEGPEAFKAFCNSGDPATDAREAAAFLANVYKETGGFGAFVEVSPHGVYCTNAGEGGVEMRAAGVEFPCCDAAKIYGCDFRGRGAIQLTWNINYGRFSEFYFGPGQREKLLKNPELVVGDGKIGWAASLWFWMTEQDYGGQCPPKQLDRTMPSGKQSCHQAMVEPKGGGFQQTVRIINGGYEACPTSSYRSSAVYRAQYYRVITSLLDVPPALPTDSSPCNSATDLRCDLSGMAYYAETGGKVGNPLAGADVSADCPKCGVMTCVPEQETKWLGVTSFSRTGWDCTGIAPPGSSGSSPIPPTPALPTPTPTPQAPTPPPTPALPTPAPPPTPLIDGCGACTTCAGQGAWAGQCLGVTESTCGAYDASMYAWCGSPPVPPPTPPQLSPTPMPTPPPTPADTHVDPCSSVCLADCKSNCGSICKDAADSVACATCIAKYNGCDACHTCKVEKGGKNRKWLPMPTPPPTLRPTPLPTAAPTPNPTPAADACAAGAGCAAGAYCDTTATPNMCVPCAAGRFGAVGNVYSAEGASSVTTCTACAANEYAGSAGQTSCVPCPIRTHTAGKTAQSGCVELPTSAPTPLLTTLPPPTTPATAAPTPLSTGRPLALSVVVVPTTLYGMSVAQFTEGRRYAYRLAVFRKFFIASISHVRLGPVTATTRPARRALATGDAGEKGIAFDVIISVEDDKWREATMAGILRMAQRVEANPGLMLDAWNVALDDVRAEGKYADLSAGGTAMDMSSLSVAVANAAIQEGSGGGAGDGAGGGASGGYNAWVVKGGIGGGLLVLLASAVVASRRRKAASNTGIRRQQTSRALQQYVDPDGATRIGPAGEKQGVDGEPGLARPKSGFGVHRPERPALPGKQKSMKDKMLNNPMWGFGKSARHMLGGLVGGGGSDGGDFKNLDESKGSGAANATPAADGPPRGGRTRTVSWADQEGPQPPCRSKEHGSTANVSPSPPPSVMAVHVALPAGWHEAIDPNSGSTYYYNDLGDTAWVRPCSSIV